MTLEARLKHSLLALREAGSLGIRETMLLTTMQADGLDIDEPGLREALTAHELARNITGVVDSLTGGTRYFLSAKGEAALAQYGL